MAIRETKIRVYVKDGKVYRCDGDYSKQATDLRYVVIPSATHEIRAVGRTWAKPSVLARENNADVAINFPYFNSADGAIIGTAIVEGTPLSYEVPKSQGRAEFYADESGYHIGRNPSPTARFAVQGAPELLRNGNVVVHESLNLDNLDPGVLNRAQRTAVGIRANGDVVFVVSDGRTKWDHGLQLTELALVFRDQLGCIHAINGDGGGSSVMYVGGKIVNAMNGAERGSGCALIAVRKPADTTPSPTAGLRIAVDAGHGPNTAGKRTPDGSMREFHFNSVVARYVRDLLAEYDGVKTMFTHDDTGGRDVPLDERVMTALGWRADVFVSIHANAFGDGWNDANGIETYTTTDRDAPSTKLAAKVQAQLIEATGLRDRGVKAADFRVLWGSASNSDEYRSTVPARILVECGFMTNRAEAKLLKSDEYRRKCAEAIVAGIVETYGLERKEVPAPADDLPQMTGAVSVLINGADIGTGYLIDGRTYVPLRAIGDALGMRVGWNQTEKIASLEGGK